MGVMIPVLPLMVQLLFSCEDAVTATSQFPAACAESYVQWAQDAEEQAASRFPDARKIDFLYVGCKSQSAMTKNYIYKYWMKDRSREFGVYVTLLVDIQLNKVIGSAVEETAAFLPAYGKWRTLAVQSIRMKYPHADIVDYAPCRCDAIDAEHGSQTFKFWIRQDHTPKFINLTMIYHLRSEKIISITFEE